MFKRLTKRVRSDDADSTLVSTVIIIPLMIMLFFTVIDMSAWFNNRSILTGVARDSARTVAIVGGTQSPLARDYVVGDIEVNLKNTLENTPGLLSVIIDEDSLDCGPDIAAGIGAETYCEFDWEYGGVGLSVFKVLASNSDDADARSALNWNKTRGTAESEVRF